VKHRDAESHIVQPLQGLPEPLVVPRQVTESCHPAVGPLHNPTVWQEHEPTLRRLFASHQAGLVNALLPLPRWVDLSTSRAEHLSHEQISGASRDGRGRSCRVVQMPVERISRSSPLNIRETDSRRSPRQFCPPKGPRILHWHSGCGTVACVRRGAALALRSINASWCDAWNEGPGGDSAPIAVEG